MVFRIYTYTCMGQCFKSVPEKTVYDSVCYPCLANPDACMCVKTSCVVRVIQYPGTCSGGFWIWKGAAGCDCDNIQWATPVSTNEVTSWQIDWAHTTRACDDSEIQE